MLATVTALCPNNAGSANDKHQTGTALGGLLHRRRAVVSQHRHRYRRELRHAPLARPAMAPLPRRRHGAERALPADLRPDRSPLTDDPTKLPIHPRPVLGMVAWGSDRSTCLRWPPR